MKQHKKFAFDISVTFIASMISMFLGLIITMILGRYLGAEELGLYRMVSTIYGITTLFASIGIPAAIIKYVAEYKADRRKINSIVSSGIITSSLLGILFGLLSLFLSVMLEGIFKMPGLSNLLKILSTVFPFTLVGGTILGFLNGIREMKKYGIATVFQSILMIIVSLVLIHQGFGVAGVIIGIVLSTIGSCFYLTMVSSRYFDIVLEGYIQRTKEILLFGSQIFGVNAINTINYQADTILIGYFLTASDVGHYGVAVGLSTFFWLIPQAIQSITYPVTSEYIFKNDSTALQIMIDKSMRYTTCVLLPTGLGLMLFGKEIIKIIFGTGFVSANLPLNILTIGTVIFGIVKSVGSSLTGAGRLDLSIKAVIISASLNIILNTMLIPYFGIIGAAIATTLSFLISAFITLILIVRILKIRIDYKWYYKLFGGLIIMFVLSNIYTGKFIFNVIIICIYLCIIFSSLEKEDKIFFKSLITR